MLLRVSSQRQRYKTKIVTIVRQFVDMTEQTICIDKPTNLIAFAMVDILNMRVYESNIMNSTVVSQYSVHVPCQTVMRPKVTVCARPYVIMSYKNMTL